MTTLFISDLHLEEDRPDIRDQFLEFLKTEAVESESLYILGDLFEVWAGDDDPNTHHAIIKQGIHGLVDRGVPVYFMHGNRDFMIGDRFANETGVTILPDPFPITMYGEKTLLSHGDALCIDDVQYQQFRKVTRDPAWQATMLKKSLEERLAIARQVRTQSEARSSSLDMNITDVNLEEVNKVIEEYGVDVLLHGHTHRPAVHNVDLGNRKAKRIVLGDWYTHGSAAKWDLGGVRLCEMTRD